MRTLFYLESLKRGHISKWQKLGKKANPKANAPFILCQGGQPAFFQSFILECLTKSSGKHGAKAIVEFFPTPLLQYLH